MEPWDDPLVERITKEYALTKYADHRQAAHAMYYSKCDTKALFDRIPMRYNVLMVMRFDGNIGFPGGFVDRDNAESIEIGINRELEEELNLSPDFKITANDYHGTYVHTTPRRKFINHFYLKEVTENEYASIEKRAFDSVEWGKETLGIINVPVQTGVGISRTYLPIVDFLQNKFIGNARQELIEGILKVGIFTEDEMKMFWKDIEN